MHGDDTPLLPTDTDSSDGVADELTRPGAQTFDARLGSGVARREAPLVRWRGLFASLGHREAPLVRWRGLGASLGRREAP